MGVCGRPDLISRRSTPAGTSQCLGSDARPALPRATHCRPTIVSPLDRYWRSKTFTGRRAGPDMTAALEARDLLDRLQNALIQLKPKTRSIFLAHRVDGHSYNEIAKQTGLSVKGVEWHMTKAIAHLDRMLRSR